MASKWDHACVQCILNTGKYTQSTGQVYAQKGDEDGAHYQFCAKHEAKGSKGMVKVK